MLNESGATLDSLVADKITNDLEAGIQNSIEALVVRMEARKEQDSDPDWHLQLAKGHMVGRDWLKAAIQLDEYVKLCPDDQVAHFSRGTAYANAREGRQTDLAAMRSYGEALALAVDNDNAGKALFLSRHGAMLKRLNRLDEAESDLQLAAAWAVDDTVRKDIWYNLAGVYAMQGKREQLLTAAHYLKGSRLEANRIHSNLHTYFADFADDEAFLAAIRIQK